MKEIVEAIRSRINSPILGYATLSAAFLNWKPIFYLMFSNSSVSDRIEYFENDTDNFSLLAYPLLLGGLFAFSHPWVKYVFLLISSKPFRLENKIQLEAEHDMLIIKKELEDIRSKTLKIKEEELIERADRDKRIHEIKDAEKRNIIEKQISKLREKRDDTESSSSKRSAEIREIRDFVKHLKKTASGEGLDLDEATEMRNRASNLERELEEDMGYNIKF